MPLHELARAVLASADAKRGLTRRAFVKGMLEVLPANAGPSGSVGTTANRDPEVAQALAEAWDFLVRHGLIAPHPVDSEGPWFVTRRGRDVLSGDLGFPSEEHLGPRRRS